MPLGQPAGHFLQVAVQLLAQHRRQRVDRGPHMAGQAAQTVRGVGVRNPLVAELEAGGLRHGGSDRQ
jgi:hypothetical protein